MQVAAGVMHSVRHWLSPRSGIDERGLLVAGGAAGIAAAFNTPLGGVLFAIEELSRNLNQRSSGLLIASIVLAGLVSVSVFGNLAYFGVVKVPALDWGLLAPGLLVVVACGLLGGLFARLLVASAAGGADRFSEWRRRHPVRFAAGCAFAVAVIGTASGGQTFGSGYAETRGLLEGEHEHLPLLYVLLKMGATWISTWSGIPGGIFAPSLSIGAGVGSDVAWLLERPELATALIAMGMTAFLAAVTQTPITSFIIVMEMVEGQRMVLSLMAAALLASLISRQVSRPLYTAMADLQLLRLKPVPPPDPAPPQAGGGAQPEVPAAQEGAGGEGTARR